MKTSLELFKLADELGFRKGSLIRFRMHPFGSWKLHDADGNEIPSKLMEHTISSIYVSRPCSTDHKKDYENDKYLGSVYVVFSDYMFQIPIIDRDGNVYEDVQVIKRGKKRKMNF